MDVREKAQALADKALARRQAAWQTIKTQEPKLAELMTGITAAFGKPDAVRVEIGGQVIIHSGTFAQPRRFYDGRLTRVSNGR